MSQPALRQERPTTTPAFADTLVHAAGSPLVDIKRTCVRIAASDATVLLTGETGTGKEVFARLIHTASPRGSRTFVPVNCGAIPEALLESELFGYVRGAFTGAVSSRRGRVALAEGGTLFLDEIGELPLPLQVKLLRLLQERTYEPVGSSESVAASFRLVAATNRDLEAEVRAGRFRSDLYYRLHVCPIQLPALRERVGDVRALFTHFWRQRGEVRSVSAEVMRCLEAYSWPGNVRELENLVERLSVCSEGPTIELLDLPAPIRGEVALRAERPRPLELVPTPPPDVDAAEAEILAGPIDPPAPEAMPPAPEAMPPAPEAMPPAPEAMPAPSAVAAPESAPGGDSALALPVDLPGLLRGLEDAYIARALAATGGNKKEAARLLGMGRTTLVEKLRRRNADASGT